MESEDRFTESARAFLEAQAEYEEACELNREIAQASITARRRRDELRNDLTEFVGRFIRRRSVVFGDRLVRVEYRPERGGYAEVVVERTVVRAP